MTPRVALSLWQRLTGPSRRAGGAWTRQHSLLAAVQLVMIALAALAAVVLSVTQMGEAASVPVALGTVGILALAYRLNQIGQHQLAALVTVGLACLAVWGTLLFGTPNLHQDTLSLAYLTLPILITGLLLPVRYTLFVAAGGLAVWWVLRLSVPAATVPNALMYLAISAGLTAVTTALRDRQVLDIEQRNRELAESVAQFRNAFEYASIGMALVSLEGTWLRVNRSLCEIIGYSEAELQALDFQTVTHPEDLKEDLALVQRLLAGEFNAYQMEKRYYHKHGHTVWVALNVSLLRASDGTPLHYITQAQDITTRKQAEADLRASEARFRSLSQSSPVGIFQADAEGRGLYFNTRWEAISGLPAAAASAQGWLQAVHLDDRPRVAAEWAQAVRDQASYGAEFRLLDSGGETRWVQARASPIRSPQGEVTGYVGTLADITERKQNEEALRTANERMGVWVAELEDHAREIGLLNELSNLLQSCLTAQEAYGILQQLGHQLFPSQTGALAIINASRNLVEPVVAWGDSGAEPAARAFSPEDCWALRRGRAHWYEAGPGAVRCPHLGAAQPGHYLCLPLLAHGEALGVLHLQTSTLDAPALAPSRRSFVQTVADSISLALANLRLRERLRDQSIRDALTGLFNRRYLEETLERELRRAERDGAPVGVLMLDLDYFKRFNDSFGHGAGDEVLRGLGRLLNRQVRVEDIPCRYGGEEFTLVLPGCSLEAATQRAEELRQEVLRLNVSHAGQSLGGVTLSVGVAAFPQHGVTETAVLGAADQALYQAKQAGRNRVVTASTP